MLVFEATSLAHATWARDMLLKANMSLCTYSFTSLYCWNKVYKQELCLYENRLLIHAETGIGKAYFWPIGEGNISAALDALEEDAKRRGEPLRFIGLEEGQKEFLEDRYGDDLQLIASRDSCDYIYDIHRLADLPGKKLHAKRNHINRFKENHPEAKFSPLTVDDIDDCLALDEIWYKARKSHIEEENEALHGERHALHTALENFEVLGLVGGLIRDGDGEVMAFTLGSHLSDTVFDVHFERAKSEIQGAFPAINQEFVRYIRETYPQMLYINREEDMGEEGLRKAKLSYGPDILLQNICAVVKNR